MIVARRPARRTEGRIEFPRLHPRFACQIQAVECLAGKSSLEDPFLRVTNKRGQVTREHNKMTRPKGRWLIPLVVLIALGALAVRATLTITRGDTRASTLDATIVNAPRISTVGELVTLVEDAYATASGLSATVETATAAGTTFSEVRIDAQGNAWSGERERSDGVVEASYRADTDTFDQLLQLGPSTELVRTTAMNSSASDVMPSDFGLLRESILALSPAGDADVGDTTFDGAPAWEAAVVGHVRGFGIGSSTTATVTVDKATRFPIALAFMDEAGTQVRTIRLHDLVINPSFDDLSFSTTQPPGVSVREVKGPFRSTDLNDVSDSLDYEPFTPSELPKDFELFSVRLADSDFADAMNEPSNDLVVITYRRGLEIMTVTNRINPGADKSGKTKDPFFNFEGIETRHDKAIDAGAVKGTVAHFVTEDIGEPYVWLAKEKQIVTVSGLLTEDQLMKAVSSLEPS